MTEPQKPSASAKAVFQPLVKKKTLGTGLKLALALIVLSLPAVWFLLSAQVVVVELQPSNAELEIDATLQFQFSGEVLLLPGQYQYRVHAPGYHTVSDQFELQQQTLSLAISLEKLPGNINITLRETGQSAIIEGAIIQLSRDDKTIIPSAKANNEKRDHVKNEFSDLLAGEYQLQVSHPLYHTYTTALVVQGMGVNENIDIDLQANYATAIINSEQAASALFIDNKPTKQIEKIKLAPGEHELRLQKEGFKTAYQWHQLTPGEHYQFNFPSLEPADTQLSLSSSPSQASVTVDGQYRGQTPLTLALDVADGHSLSLFKAGYQVLNRSINAHHESLHLNLKAELGKVTIHIQPKHAQLYIDNKKVSLQQGQLQLPSREHKLRFSAKGYADLHQTILPSAKREQRLSFSMKTVQQQRFANLKNQIKTAAGQQLKLFHPKHNFTLGSSRREQGRRANEAQRKVSLKRSFYLGLREVTNQQFQQFDQQHSSSHVKGTSLNGANSPVVNVSWEQAALYCNWLSKKDKLPAFYKIEKQKIVGYNPKATGYRLPTEAEWSWAARLQNDGSMLKFSWGSSMTPLDKSAQYGSNIADRSSARLVGAALANYQDGFAASAPVGSYKANRHGLYDLGGNVSEWLHDIYQIKTGLSQAQETNPMGPQIGKHRVIRGPAWNSGRITELRMAFRNYGVDKKPSVGFRLARSALAE